MDYSQLPQQIIEVILTPTNLVLLAIGTFSGILVGAIPGLSGGMALTLLVSFTYGWGTEQAMSLIVGSWVGVVYGGSWSATLLNMPGAPSAIATSFDGYPLSRQGKGGQAIGLATIMSFIGGIFGLILLAVAAPAIKNIAMRFGAHEYFVLVLFGLTLVGSLGGKSLSRGILAAALGIFIGMIGMDPGSGIGRFTFGSTYLLGGVHFIPVLIGLFAISEVLFQLGKAHKVKVVTKIGRVLPELKTITQNIPLTIRSSFIGVFCGAIPGVGADIAALLSYGQAQKTVRKPSAPFGKGAYEGIVATESANNSCIGGTLIPMLSLGIPGDSSTAIVMGAMLLHGIRPGPMLMIENQSFYWLILVTMIFANIFMLVLGLTTIQYCARVVMVRKEILMPLIVMFAVVGAYSVQYNYIHVFVVVIFGVLGYLMKVFNYPVGPMVLGVILSPLLEMNFRRAVVISGNTIPDLLSDLVTRPISAILLFVLVLVMIAKTPLAASISSRLFKRFQKDA